MLFLGHKIEQQQVAIGVSQQDAQGVFIGALIMLSVQVSYLGHDIRTLERDHQVGQVRRPILIFDFKILERVKLD